RHPVVRFPFDFSWMVRRFLDAVGPKAVALMELEVWPNLAQSCQARGVPLVVINGRLSDASFGSYRWARRWVKPMFQGLSAVAAQTEEYAQRFRELGTPPDRVVITDTMKWDTVRLADQVDGSRELGAALGIDPDRPLVVAGSTGPGEEELLLADRPQGVQLLLVPRKPERFDEVARLAPGMARRSLRPDGADTETGPRPGADLFLLDTMGELTKAYALADVALVGRSFVPMGGSDPIEPVALGKPTVMGPHHDNFRDVVTALADAGGIRITNRPMDVVEELLDDPEKGRVMAQGGREAIRRRQGATGRHVELLQGVLGVSPETGKGASQGGADGEAPNQGAGSEDGSPPRRRLRRWLIAAFGVYMAAGYLTTAFSRAEMEEAADPEHPLPTLSGALASGVFSVHTDRSHDARGTREQVGKAAASAGLDFVVVGDHPPDDRKPGWEFWEPRTQDGVLVVGGGGDPGPRSREDPGHRCRHRLPAVGGKLRELQGLSDPAGTHRLRSAWPRSAGERAVDPERGLRAQGLGGGGHLRVRRQTPAWPVGALSSRYPSGRLPRGLGR
ncbi:3-deoxy-D-manno-octulosonic acid transferase, partial [Gemmatimonadota bacterium]